MTDKQAKTIETANSVSQFIKKSVDKERRKDCFGLIEIMQKQSGCEPKMWGSAIVGFGRYHYVYESGHEGDAPLVGFSPRKKEFALYTANFDGKDELLKVFGKHTRAKACVYFKTLNDIDTNILKKLIVGSVKYYKTKYH